MVPVCAFPDDYDVGAFVDAISGIRRHEGHGLYILIEVIVQLLENLEFTAFRSQRLEKSSRENVGNLTIVAAEEENGNHDKPNLESPAAASEEGTVEGPGRLHHGPGEAHGTGNDDTQGDDRHH